LSRPAPGLDRGGEPGQGRSVAGGRPVGGWEELVGRGGGGWRSDVGGGKRTRSASGGGDSPVCERQVHQFASGGGRSTGSRVGIGEGIGQWEVFGAGG
jgi:hypothetical protein